jgi:hypothetical protein
MREPGQKDAIIDETANPGRLRTIEVPKAHKD